MIRFGGVIELVRNLSRFGFDVVVRVADPTESINELRFAYEGWTNQ